MTKTIANTSQINLQIKNINVYLKLYSKNKRKF